MKKTNKQNTQRALKNNQNQKQNNNLNCDKNIANKEQTIELGKEYFENVEASNNIDE